VSGSGYCKRLHLTWPQNLGAVGFWRTKDKHFLLSWERARGLCFTRNLSPGRVLRESGGGASKTVTCSISCPCQKLTGDQRAGKDPPQTGKSPGEEWSLKNNEGEINTRPNWCYLAGGRECSRVSKIAGWNGSNSTTKPERKRTWKHGTRARPLFIGGPTK